MKILTHEGLQYFYNQIAAKFSTKEQTAEAIEEAVGNAGVGTVTSVNGKTGVVQLSASDVGALPASTQIPSIAGLATETYVDNKVASMVDSAPETLNTLNELAAALGDDPNFATTVATEIGGKVSKSGDTMTGVLITPATYTKGEYPSHGYMNADGTPVVLMQVDANNNRLGIHQKRGGASVWDSNEAYMLPAPNLDQTATVVYDILTSKNPVTIAQGGTGATTAAAALTNLGAFGALGNAADFGSDLNNFTQIGAVLVSSDVANRPEGTSVYGICWNVYGKANTYIEQHYVNAATLKRYIRFKIDNVWRAWAQEYDSNFKPTLAEIGAAASEHTHSNITDGAATARVGVAATPILIALKNGNNHWAIERAGDNINSLAWHYYNPSSGNWLGSSYLLDNNNFTTYVTPSAIGALPTNPGSIEMSPGASSNHGGFIDFHYNGSTSDHTSRIIESASSVLDINNVSGGKVRLGTVTAGTWNGSAIPVANGGTGATDAATARTNLGALPGQTISYTLSTAGWYRIASSKVGIDNTIGDFTICGGGSGTHTIVSFKAAIAIGKNPQILQLLNTTYNGVNQYTKARIVYHTTYSGNYAYLEVYKNGTASSSTKFMYYGEGWTLQKPVAGSIPSGYTSKEFTFVPQTSIASAENINVVSDVTGKDFDVGVQNPNGHIALQVSTNRGLWDYDKSAWVLRALKGSADWHLFGSADSAGSAGLLNSSVTPTYGINGLQYFNASLSTSSTADGTITHAPTADWWHILRMNHGNPDGYYIDIGACFHQDYLAYRRVASGNDSGWTRILDEKNGLLKSGGTLTGALSLASGLYAEGDTLDATQYALDMNNSNIIGANGIYMNDASDGITEGIHFYRSTTTYDSIWAANGKLYFTPNRPLKGAGTAYTVYHTGNKPSASDVGAAPASHTHNFITDGNASAFVGVATTPILSVRKGSYNHWGIERVGDSDNRLKWHYYDPSTGSWQGNAILIDSNGGTINGAVTINNTLTATKVIGAVYA